MKYAKIASILILLITSCTAKKISEFENGIISFSGCPDGGKCNVEQIRDSQISLQEDTTGQMYPKIDKSNTYHLYKLSFTKEVEDSIMDAEYQEVIYFQIEKSKTYRKLNNKALDRAKVIYGRQCYCPEETGFEPILSGNLLFETFRQVTEIHLEIKPDTLPVEMNKALAKVTFHD